MTTSTATLDIPFVHPSAVQIIARNLRNRTASAFERVRRLQRRVKARAVRQLNSTAALRWSYDLMNTPAPAITRYHE